MINYDFSQFRDKSFKDTIAGALDIKIAGNDKKSPGFSCQKDKAGRNNGGFPDYGYPIIGTDESGKGDYFGPLVIAGVFVDEVTAKKLFSLGVTDSKLLDDYKIRKIAPEIREICRDGYSVIEISPQTYNRLYDQFRKEGKNLNHLLAWGHAKAIEEILGKKDSKRVISDKFGNERYILSKLQEKGRKIELIQVCKAEQNIAVAAASVLARERFIKKIDQLSALYNINIPKGAGPGVIKAGKQLVSLKGKDELKKSGKVHFKTTEKILNQL
ncbi:ribonuclease HIII [Methanoplanus sp. FWC-SCC4]|uniref:Ribonuclease n=2 Tax=Methanochimaera problematica TaxID=2609417 RepID=A0AA97FE33_9EURY|nr:ribonuclease HIII [Methanoplanus sp. FWC-SCC4]